MTPFLNEVFEYFQMITLLRVETKPTDILSNYLLRPNFKS